ncbi:P-type conjugative transfer ATPase TrbB (plasmid) [Ensifer adhaerens]|uniref:P-type conjugative transfer ATPase TrbB n=1 Tax=Ensifer adhaerens TaxID=106592 RepID=UPI0023A9BB3A|nr:P-type conjugative transfer ATPase TrbB [Ensifer adhaerens]WDZ81698.1 P-type conjugative transfer ATPase TrbB [Ensifer adhaerens]
MTAVHSTSRLVRKLEEVLGPDIRSALADPSVVEIMLNSDGNLFVERLGQTISRIGQMDTTAAEIAIGGVAHSTGTTVDERRPIISAELPIGGHRFEGLLPPVVQAPVFCIRKRASRLVPLDDYVSDGSMTAEQACLLRHAVDNRFNILVSGGTGSGKTTLANALIAEIAAVASNDRLIILEDTVEIRCGSRNALALRTSDEIDMQRLLKSTLRLRPDRIIVGEVRDGAALSLLKSWNTGHPGGIATVHANSARSALRRIEQLTAEATPQPMQSVIGEAIDLVVSIERTATGRRLGELLRVGGHDGTAYRLEPYREGNRDAA